MALGNFVKQAPVQSRLDQFREPCNKAVLGVSGLVQAITGGADSSPCLLACVLATALNAMLWMLDGLERAVRRLVGRYLNTQDFVIQRPYGCLDRRGCRPVTERQCCRLRLNREPAAQDSPLWIDVNAAPRPNMSRNMIRDRKTLHALILPIGHGSDRLQRSIQLAAVRCHRSLAALDSTIPQVMARSMTLRKHIPPQQKRTE